MISSMVATARVLAGHSGSSALPGASSRVMAAAVARAMSARLGSFNFSTDQTSRKVMREPPTDSLLSFSSQFYRHPSAPVVVGWVDLDAPPLPPSALSPPAGAAERLGAPTIGAPLQAMNRNARTPKRANRGKRAVSRQARRAKKRAFGNHRR